MASSSPITVRRLENPSDSEIERIVDVFYSAFCEGPPDDPFGPILVGGDRSLFRPNFEYSVRVALIGGEAHIATIGPETKDIVGVALWYGPGQSPMTTDEEREIGSRIFFSKCTEEHRKWWLENFLPFMNRLSTDTLGPGIKDANWALLLFAVDRAHHRKGIGKAMMKVTEDKAKEKNQSIVLETATELDLLIYKRMGFEIKGSMTITSPVGSCPVYQLMKTPKA